AIALFLLLWAATRRGRLPRPALEMMEAAVSVFACVGYAVMVTRTNAEMELFIPVVAALTILMARAVFIPTSPRRTLLVSVIGSIPAIVATWILSYRLNIQTSIPRGIGPTVYAGCWAGTGVAVAT